jgi:hypothetical protein
MPAAWNVQEKAVVLGLDPGGTTGSTVAFEQS